MSPEPVAAPEWSSRTPAGTVGTASAHAPARRPVRLIRSDASRFDGWATVVDADSLDSSQRAAVSARGPVVAITGAPGTGKTTVAVHQVVSRVRDDGLSPEQCVLVTSSRVSAAHVRGEVTRLVAAGTGSALASSMQAFGFAVLARAARLRQSEPPRLLDGAEQDVILADLLEGHAQGRGRVPQWPEEVTEALGTRGFRAELRDLLMRAVEYGVSPEELRQLGAAHHEPAWVAAADVLEEYDQVTVLSRPGAFDPSLVLGAAAGTLLDASPDEFPDLVGQARVVVVDDAQELTAAASTLLSVVASRGVHLVLVGDPDAATQTFRGADPRLLATGWEGVDLPDPLVLSTRWRQNPDCAAVTAAVAQGIGVIGTAAHRAARAPGAEQETDSEQPPDIDKAPEGTPPVAAVSTVVADTASAEEAHIAALLRREHLLSGRPWSDMAVIVRGSARTASLRRSLGSAGVPVDVAGARLPLRDETAVRPLLDLYGVVLHVAEHTPRLSSGGQKANGSEKSVDEGLEHHEGLEHSEGVEQHGGVEQHEDAHQGAGALLTSDHLLVLDELVAGGLVFSDAVAGRRARRALVRHHRAAGGRLRAAQVLAAAVFDETTDLPLRSDPDLAPVRRLRAIARAGVAAAGVVDAPNGVTWAPGVTSHSVLWAMWSAADVADTWRAVALAGGPGAERADRDLDAVVALFNAADTYVQRLPKSSPKAFLDHVLAQDVAADSLAARGQRGRQVALTTPAGAVGREWGLVVVAGLQDGVWPDTRLRGSLLGSERLVDVVAARGDSVPSQVVEVLRDEARLFCSAVGRARERLVCTAVSNDDEQPSAFLTLVDNVTRDRVHERLREGGDEPDNDAQAPVVEQLTVSDVPRAMSMAGLVGELRRRLAVSTDPSRRERYAQRLAVLAQQGVPGADPDTWWPDLPLTGDDNVLPSTARVRISPSRMQTFSECPLRWFLSAAGGEAAGAQVANSVGTLVHDIAAHHEGDFPAMAAELEQRWPELELPEGWTSRRLLDNARSMVDLLARYQNEAAGEGWEVAAKEIDIRASCGNADIRGRIDRLERDAAGRLRVVDLKTGKSKPTEKEVAVHPQLAVYQVALEAGALAEHGGESGGAALVQIGAAAGRGPKVQEQAPLADHDDPRWAHTMVEDAARDMAGAQFPARPGSWCRGCASRPVCPAQSEGETL